MRNTDTKQGGTRFDRAQHTCCDGVSKHTARRQSSIHIRRARRLVVVNPPSRLEKRTPLHRIVEDDEQLIECQESFEREIQIETLLVAAIVVCNCTHAAWSSSQDVSARQRPPKCVAQER